MFFDHIFVHTDGDPGALGDGDFTFDMGAGDLDTQDMLGATQYAADISGGENRAINQSVAIEPAPAGIYVQVNAEDDDSFWGMFGADPMVSFMPEGSEWWTQDDFVEGVHVTKWFDLTGAGPDPQEIPFTLETGPKHIDFSLNCRLRFEASPGVNLQPMVKKSAKPTVRAKSVAMVVTGERVALAGRPKHVVMLAQDGGLYHAYERDRAMPGGQAQRAMDAHRQRCAPAADRGCRGRRAAFADRGRRR